MAQIGSVLEQLKQERARLEKEVRQVNEAIRALSKVELNSSGSFSKAGKVRRLGSRGRRTLSLAARKRIAAAQRARWAKFHAQAKKKVA